MNLRQLACRIVLLLPVIYLDMTIPQSMLAQTDIIYANEPEMIQQPTNSAFVQTAQINRARRLRSGGGC